MNPSPAAEDTPSGFMRRFTADSNRALLHVLFFLFEILLVGSVAVLVSVASVERHRHLPVSDAAGIALWFSFIGQLVVCFLLRRVSRRLAVVGWLTLFGVFWLSYILL